MVIVGLGANLMHDGRKPQETLRLALERLERNGARVERLSRFFCSPAWPDPSDPPFVNAVANLSTTLEPTGFLELLHDAERAFGRVRGRPNAPRTLDLDLLDYNGVISAATPVLPHPRLVSRAFVLLPLKDIAPEWRHPVTHHAVDELIAALSAADRDAARPIS